MNLRIHPVLGLAAVLAICLAGCGTSNDAAGPQVATAQQPTTVATGKVQAAASPSSAVKESRYDKALRYTRCMTDNGVKMADPVEGKALITGASRGNASVMPDEISGWINIPADTFNRCKQFLPDTWPVKEDPAQLARERPFGECMRKHGVAWPEPDADGMVNYSVAQHESPKYLEAETACKHLYVDAANQG
ncbi:hypothetical protein ACIBBG_33170 [Micromonospora chersina]|uniref:hypothetical protein n=1 Tax=Micromonospora chersina TaxID=47854 RepID=UPI0037B222B8